MKDSSAALRILRSGEGPKLKVSQGFWETREQKNIVGNRTRERGPV